MFILAKKSSKIETGPFEQTLSGQAFRKPKWKGLLKKKVPEMVLNRLAKAGFRVCMECACVSI